VDSKSKTVYIIFKIHETANTKLFSLHDQKIVVLSQTVCLTTDTHNTYYMLLIS